jgi:hypothetical protein
MSDRNPLAAAAKVGALLALMALADFVWRPTFREPWQIHLLGLTWLIVPLVALVWLMRTFRPKE